MEPSSSSMSRSASSSSSRSQSEATTPRSQAVAMLRRAASNRESPARSGSPNSRNGSPSLAPPSPELVRTPSPSHRHTSSEDTTLFLNASPGSTSLERTASLLARSTALAKLTGAAPPTPPPSFYSPPLGQGAFVPAQPLPSLEELRERARAKAAAGGSPTLDGASGLRRNHTVTGVGGAARSPPLGLGMSVDDVNAASSAQDDNKPILDRAEARVNLMRKLSSRRLESPAPSESPSTSPSRERERERGEAGVVGRRGKARPRSGSMGALDWRMGAREGEEEVPAVPSLPFVAAVSAVSPSTLPPLNIPSPLDSSFPTSTDAEPPAATPIDSARSATSMSGRSSGVWRAERDRESWAARQGGGDKAWEFEDSTAEEGEGEEEEEVIRRSQAGVPPALGEVVHGATGDEQGKTEDEDEEEDGWEMVTPRPPQDQVATSGRFRTRTPTPKESPPRLNDQGEHPQESEQAFVFDPRAAAARAAAAAAAANSHRALAAENYPLTGAGGVPIVLRRGSIPEHLRPSSRSPQPLGAHGLSAIATSSLGLPAAAAHRQPPAPSFGIRAVEESESDIRRRGSSASSSVAFLETRRGQGSAGTLARSGSVSSEGMLGLGVGLGGESGSVSPLSEKDETSGELTRTNGEDEIETVEERVWGEGLREQRLAAKVERKREAGLARSKEGAFPPPDEGYQFPSPTIGSPRDSTDEGSPSTSPTQEAQGLFDTLSSNRPRSRASPYLPSATSPFLPTYMPLSLPTGQSPIITSPILDREPLSPTSKQPDIPHQRLAGSTTPPPSATGVASQPLERTASSESSKRRWFAAAMNKSKSGGSSEMQRQDSNRSTKSTLGGGGKEPATVVEAPGTPKSVGSNYSSSTEMRRDLSNSSFESFLPIQPRHLPMPPEDLPSNKILARLDSFLAPASEESSTALDDPPRKLLLHTPVLQVVNANTVKDRHLFLFNDLLLITKPLIEDDPETGAPLPVTLDTSFVVKSVVELNHLHLLAAADPVEHREKDSKRHPLLVSFIDRFANDPKKAIGALIQRGNLSNDAQTIAHLIFKNPELNRNQVGAYFAEKDNRHILRAYIERFRFSGVRIDDALRMFLMSLRLPNNLEAAEQVLGVLAHQWTDVNGSNGFDPSLTTNLVLAVMRLSDALHSGMNGNDGIFSMSNPTLSVDDFIASFRELDPRFLVPEDLLTRIYASVRRERIEQASDNSIFSMTPDIEASMSPSRLPLCLTYRAQSEPITISIPEPDPKFSIKLHGTDLKFDPPLLSFAKSSTQTFRVTGTALGSKCMVLIKVGANAPRYQGLPLNKVFSIERAFMQHTFQVSFTNHLDVKRKYMFSTLDASVRTTWLRAVRERINTCLQAPPPPTAALQAAQAVAVQVLCDSLIPPEEAPPGATPSAAPSPRPNTAAPRFGTPSAAAHPPRSRLGTPTRAGPGALVRSLSFSKIYAHHFKVESDLTPDVKKQGGGAGGLSAATVAGIQRRGSRDENAAMAALAASPFTKKGSEIVVTTEQNSLLPLVLSFLGAGLPAAPLPMSSQGSAFQLPPLPPTNGETYPNVSFVEKQSV